MPHLSVVMPTHRRPVLLARAIASLQAQTFGDFELLVVDDASGDDTPATLAALAAADPRIRALPLERNLGPGGARNHALARARGELVAFLDDDDLAKPERFARQIARFAARPEVELVVSTVAWVDAAGSILRVSPGKMRRGELPTTAAALCRWLYLESNWLPTSALMVRRATLEGCRFLEDVAAGEDWFFLLQWTALAARRAAGPEVAQIAYDAEPLVEVLRDPGHLNQMADKRRAHAAQRRALEAFRAWLGAQGLRELDDLHALARVHQWQREARYLGGWRALPLLLRSSLMAPGAAASREGWRWLAGRLRERLG